MSNGITLQTLTFLPDLLSVEWSDGQRTDFTSLWLADNDPVHRDAHSGQRLIDVANLPDEPKIRQATMNDAHVRIDWQDGAPPTSIAIAWLASQRQRPAAGAPRPVTLLGDAQEMDAYDDFAWLTLQQLRDKDARVATWFMRLGMEGLAFVSEVPARDGAILDAVAPRHQTESLT